MILRLYKSITPSVLFLILITGIAYWLKAMLYPEEISFAYDSYSMPAYRILADFFRNQNLISVFTGFTATLLIAILMVRLNTTYFFIERRSYLPALFFVLGTGIFVPLQRVNPVLPAILFFVIALDRVFLTYKCSGTSFRFFDAGLLIGLGSFFYIHLIFYLPILWIGLIILRPFNWREWLVTLLGFFTPLALMITIYFLSGAEIIRFFENVKINIIFPFYYENFDLYDLVFLSYLGLLILIFSIYMIRNFSSIKISSRKYLDIMLWIFILTLIIYFFVPSASVELILILFIPLSYLFTYFFVSVKSAWIGNILLGLFMAGIAIVQIF
ncbi:MAG: hypothetical protein JSV24_10870 [Bacteroidales bacterium]|nr:MAG: hypothetical protein JSV24_10870 [Bacteroidales bacterium]